jgi:hypothetical protein
MALIWSFSSSVVTEAAAALEGSCREVIELLVGMLVVRRVDIGNDETELLNEQTKQRESDRISK